MVRALAISSKDVSNTKERLLIRDEELNKQQKEKKKIVRVHVVRARARACLCVCGCEPACLSPSFYVCVFQKCGKVEEMHENAPAHTHSILMGFRENRQTIQRMNRLSLRNSP